MSYWQSYPKFEHRAGCYAILSRGRVLYVGSARDIARRFDQHGFNFSLGGALFSRTFGQISLGRIKVKYSLKMGDFLMWEYRLIVRLRPELNCIGLGKRRRGDVGKITSLPALRKGLADRPKPAAML